MGHVFVSFLVLLLMHGLKKRTENSFEWDEMCLDLAALYEVEVKSNVKTYFLHSKLRGVCGKVFKAAGVEIPPSAIVGM